MSSHCLSRSRTTAKGVFSFLAERKKSPIRRSSPTCPSWLSGGVALTYTPLPLRNSSQLPFSSCLYPALTVFGCRRNLRASSRVLGRRWPGDSSPLTIARTICVASCSRMLMSLCRENQSCMAPYLKPCKSYSPRRDGETTARRQISAINPKCPVFCSSRLK
jgi:hypothetical protein